MPVLTLSDRMSVLEAVKRDGVTPDQRRIIETLAETNELLRDAVILPANNGTQNKTVFRTVLPRGTHRKINQATKPQTSEVDTITDSVCQLTGYSEVDATLVDNQVSPQEFLQGETDAFLSGMAQDQAFDIIYGDNDADSGFINGFAKRRAVLGDMCFDAGGTTAGKLSSLYIVKWGQTFTHLLYPRGASGLGVKREDKGVVTVSRDNGNLEMYRSYFECNYGITVRHPKSLLRIANIDETMQPENLVRLILAVSRNLAPGAGSVSILANNSVLGIIDAATVGKSNVCYTAEDPWGKEIVKLRDMRFRQCDAILSTEDAVTA